MQTVAAASTAGQSWSASFRVTGGNGEQRWVHAAAVPDAQADAHVDVMAPEGAVQPAPGDPVRLRFEVRDSGIGLSAEPQARLFRRFEQAEASTARNCGGTGLGPAIVRGIVEQMGGQMNVQSTAQASAHGGARAGVCSKSRAERCKASASGEACWAVPCTTFACSAFRGWSNA